MMVTALICFSCIRDEVDKPDHRSQAMEIIIDNSGPEGSKEKVRTVRFIVFDNVSTARPELDLNEFKAVTEEEGTGFSTLLEVKANPDKMVIAIVNEPSVLTNQLNTVSWPRELEDITYSLGDVFSTVNVNHYILGNSAIPMTGVKRDIEVTEANTENNPARVSMTVERTVSRVDLYLRALPDTQIAIQSGSSYMILSNTCSAGFLVAGTEADGTRDWNNPYNPYNFGHLQPGTILHIDMWLPQTSQTVNLTDQYTHFISFYTAERTSDKANDADKLILKWQGLGERSGTYVLKEFTQEGSGGPPEPLNIIKRNNVYKILGSITNTGIDFTATVTDWQSLPIDPEIEKPYFLSLSRTEVIEYNRNKFLDQQPITVNTDWTGGWTSEIYTDKDCTQPQVDGWLTMSDMQGQPVAKDITLTFADRTFNTRYIKFTAGRKHLIVKVEHSSIVPLFARSNVMMESGNLRFAVTEDDNDRMPAWSQGLMFKWGSLFAVSAAGKTYDPAKHILYNPTNLNPEDWGDSLTGWDKIPYAHPDFGFPDPQIGEHVDAFKAYSGYTGFVEAAGIGDICRYISSKGWVEGNWRMPTGSELEALYDEIDESLIYYGDYINTTTILDADPNPYLNGTFNSLSGWFLGAGVTGSTGSDPNNTIKPPTGTAYLPAAGYRYPNGEAETYNVGVLGYYWSGSPSDTYVANCLGLSKWGYVSYESDFSYGYAVRCIMDY